MTIRKSIAEFMAKFVIILVSLIIAIICCYFLFLHEETPLTPEPQKLYQAQEDSLNQARQNILKTLSEGDFILVGRYYWACVIKVENKLIRYKALHGPKQIKSIGAASQMVTKIVRTGTPEWCSVAMIYLRPITSAKNAAATKQ